MRQWISGSLKALLSVFALSLAACGGESDSQKPAAALTTTFTIGGTVALSSGGSGILNGLILGNGSDSLSIPTFPAIFTFPTPIIYGGSYDVSVQAQPTNIFCSVSNNSGNSVATNVTNVAVDCALNTKILHTFENNGTDGGGVVGPPLLASDGNLYVSTNNGGAYGDGTINRITPAGVETALYSFHSANGDGRSPAGGLVQGSDGNLYGTTQNGGANGYGTVFKVSLSGTETILHSFVSGDGTGPSYGLLLASDGKLYGVTSAGMLFSITQDGSYNAFSAFTQTVGRIIQASDGNFYGVTLAGGSDGGGSVYKMTPAGQVSTLYSFTYGSTDIGLSPQAGVVEGLDGNLYGATSSGGPVGGGTFYRLTLSGVATRLVSFGFGQAISTVTTDLVRDSAGNFYGVNFSGPIFMVTSSGSVSTVTDFSFTSPTYYKSTSITYLTIAGDGNIYGIGNGGPAGYSNPWSVFKVTLR